ncbi:MAG TPA: Si-specific NAD(P)(+) transhydrogenase [Candidatus Nanopelagicales bacterium]|nr:Si-specific NAD(P)(+) transhydrogenase [Candidatus Nanopelagicales bacterium]
MSDDYDLVVIGSGPAGEKGATQAAYYGHRVAVVERRAGAGGSAIAVSGVPVKALRDAALYLSGWSRRDTFGVGLDLTRAEVMSRLHGHTFGVVSSMAEAVAANLDRHGVDVVHGDASVGADRTVSVSAPDGSTRVLHAGTVLLATGSRPHHPAGLPFDDSDVHDSESILSIDALPARIVIVGAGPVGTEYASILAAVGVDVTLVDPGGRLLPMVDSEVADALAGSLERAGATLVLDGRVQSVVRDGDELVVDLGEGRTLRADAVLHALGRTGNVEGMGLEELGVEIGPRGRVVVDRDFRTTVPWVYAAGDITGPPGLASVAMEQARVAMCRAFGIPFKEVLDEFVPTGIYTLPEVSMVGLTEAAARALSDDVGTGRTWFSGNARARISGSTEGMLKLVFRQSDRTLLGAHIVGEEATELIHVAQAVLHRGGAIDEFIDTTFNFPTRADAYKYAAYDGLPPRASTLKHAGG